VLVEIQTAPSRRAEAVGGLEAIGVRVHSWYADLLAAYAPPSSLDRLADVPGVQRASATPPIWTDEVTSEGVAETNASAWQAAGYDGTGVKIGIIDGGFIGYAALLGGELPAAANVVAWGAGSGGSENGGTDHGTAVAEIVHDVAPGAKLYIARVDTEVDIGNAKDWMVSQGVKVINTSLGWPSWGPGDGTGQVDTIVSNAVGSGVFWASSSGNDRRGHWMGDFTDANSNGALNWDGSSSEFNTFGANQGWVLSGVLRWNDSWTNASQDYDLILCQWTGSAWAKIAQSANYQDGAAGRTPYEEIAVTAPANAVYGWVVTRYSATQTAVDFDLFTKNLNLDDPANPNPHFYDHARSITVPGDNPSSGFMAAGAVGRSPGFAQEDYSSEGPTKDNRTAPECAAPASVTTATYPAFAGTSASSPHLAALAALVRQAYPSYTPAQVETYLENSAAIDMGAPGPDNQFGYGRLLLPTAPGTHTPPTVTSPNGGETWLVGSNHTITWSTGNGGNVTIELSRNNGSGWETLFATTANDGSESWTVSGAVTSQALVRISNGNGSDSSNASFTISAAAVAPTVTSPNGGETWLVGSSHAIAWSTGNGGNVKIELSRNNGASWETLFASTANDGSESWTVSGAATIQAKVRISNVSGTDSSDASFTIEVPSSDTTPPAVTASGYDAAWHNHGVTLTLTASDAESGVRCIWWSRNDDPSRYQLLGYSGQLTVKAPADHSWDGDNAILYYGEDNAGNYPDPVTTHCHVKIDTRKPTTKAPYAASVVRYRTATLRYKVVDARPGSPTASGTIKVKNRAGKVVKTLTFTAKPVNTLLRGRFTVPRTWRVGTYRFYVYAKDAAGNAQASVGSNRLIVK